MFFLIFFFGLSRNKLQLKMQTVFQKETLLESNPIKDKKDGVVNWEEEEIGRREFVKGCFVSSRVSVRCQW